MTPPTDPGWSGPTMPATTGRAWIVLGFVVVLPVVCLVPLGPPVVHAAVVFVLLAAAVAVRALPPAPRRPHWRIDASGVTARGDDGDTAQVGADTYDAIAFTQVERVEQVQLVATTRSDGPEPPRRVVVHEAPLDRTGTALSLCLVARRLGLELLLSPAGAALVGGVESRLRDAIGTATPAVAGAPDAVFTDPAGGGVARAVVLRLVAGLAGLALVATLAAPSVGPTVVVGVAATIGAWVALAALPRLARGRGLRSSLRWRIDGAGIEVVDTERGSRRFAVEQIGAVVIVLADHPGHGTSPRPAALVVDRTGRPVVELPLRSLPPSDVTAALRGHGVAAFASGVAPWDLWGGLGRATR